MRDPHLLESRSNVNGQQGALTWLDQFAGYLEVERNYSSHTIRAYLNDLRQLIDSTSRPIEQAGQGVSLRDSQGQLTGFSAKVGEAHADFNRSEPGLGESASWLEAEGLKAYIRQIQEQYSRPTVARKISAIRSFYKYLRREQLIDEDPSRLVRGPKLTRKLPSCLDRDEVVRLLLSPDMSVLGVRDRALMEVL